MNGKSSEVSRTPGIRRLERVIEVEHALEIVAGVTGLAHQQPEFNHREHNGPEIGRAPNTPVFQHEACGNTKSLEGQIADRARQFSSIYVPAGRQSRLLELQGGKDKQVRALVKSTFTVLYLTPDSIPERKFRQVAPTPLRARQSSAC